MQDLTKIREPLALLDEETKEALKAHGGPYQMADRDGWIYHDGIPAWYSRFTYRVAPTTKPSIDWDVFTDDVVAIAVDGSDRGWCFFSLPHLGDLYWHGAQPRRIEFLASYKRGTCDWRDSLVIRPGYEAHKGEGEVDL